MYESLLCQNHRIFLSNIQHVPHLGPREYQCFQFPRLDGDLIHDALLDLGDAAAFVIGDLALIGFVGPVILHGAGPKTPIDFVTCHDLFRFSSEDQQVLKAGRLQIYRKTPEEKKLLLLVYQDERRIGDQLPEIVGVGEAGSQGEKKCFILEDIGKEVVKVAVS